MLSPDDAAELVGRLKKTLRSRSAPHPLHERHGLYDLLKAIDAGVDIVDTCLAPLRSARRTRPSSRSLSRSPAARATLASTWRACSRSASTSRRSPRSTRLPRRHETVGHRHRRAHPPDPGWNVHQPGRAAPGGRRARPSAGRLRGAAADEARAGLPAPGHADHPDRRHAGRDERALRPLQDGHQRGGGFLSSGSTASRRPPSTPRSEGGPIASRARPRPRHRPGGRLLRRNSPAEAETTGSRPRHRRRPLLRALPDDGAPLPEMEVRPRDGAPRDPTADARRRAARGGTGRESPQGAACGGGTGGCACTGGVGRTDAAAFHGEGGHGRVPRRESSRTRQQPAPTRRRRMPRPNRRIRTPSSRRRCPASCCATWRPSETSSRRETRSSSWKR